MRASMVIVAALFSMALAGCGGGGGGDERPASICTATKEDPFRRNCPASPGTPSDDAPLTDVPSVATPTIALSLTTSSGTATTQVSPDQEGTLQALVKKNGLPVANVAVSFTTSDKTAVLVPASGTALTDGDGIARVGLPPGTQLGAFTATAVATVNSVALNATTGYTVAFPTLTLSPLSIAPSTLSARGSAGIGVTVLNGSSPYAPSQAVSFTSPCIAAGKARITSAAMTADGKTVMTTGGTATATYIDQGCAAADVITASTTLGGQTATRTGTITVLPATAGAIKFVSANTTNIALKNTGGVGRQEYSVLTFEVNNIAGQPAMGTVVDFEFANTNVEGGVNGLNLVPLSGTTDANGQVTTVVWAGTVPTSVRVRATVRGSSPVLASLSNVLVVSTGVPDQKHFSLSTAIGNCEGYDFDQYCSTLTATLGDHFGNPVPDGTAVNFIVEGGVIGASCYTGDIPDPTTPLGQSTNSSIGPGSGTCSVTLRSSNPRPHDGRVTVLAYALGEEDFFDANGNNLCDGCDTVSGPEFSVDKSPDIFRNDDEDLGWSPGEPCIGPNTNGTCSTPGNGEYDGVLRTPRVPQTVYVTSQLVQIFSGSDADISIAPQAPACASAEGSVSVQVTVSDFRGNIMPAGTTVAFTTAMGAVTPASFTVPNVVYGIGTPMIVPTYTVSVPCKAGGGTLFVTVTTPNQVQTIASVPVTARAASAPAASAP